MLRELQHLIDGVRPLRRRLQREPFVEHQRVVVEALVKGVERRLPLRRLKRHEDAERTLPIGHVVGPIELRLGERCRLRSSAADKQAERDRAQPADTLGVR